MRVPPSRRLHKNLIAVTSDNDYIDDLEKRASYLTGITEAMESPFGVILIRALENLEATALEDLYKSMTKLGTNQAKAEVKTARYIKAVLMGYVYEKEAFNNSLNQYIEMEQGVQTDD